MVIDGAAKMSDSRCARLICLELKSALVSPGHRCRGRRKGRYFWRACSSLDGLLGGGGIGSPGHGQEGVALRADGPYPRLQHNCWCDGGLRRQQLVSRSQTMDDAPQCRRDVLDRCSIGVKTRQAESETVLAAARDE